MAYSYQNFYGDGSQKIFTFPFDYLDPSHVFVMVDGVNTTFTFNSANIITLDSTPAVDSLVEIFRVTPRDRLVDYANNTVQDAEDFDLDSNQLLFLIHEALDNFDKAVSKYGDSNVMFADIDLNNTYKIINSGDPIDPNDLIRLKDIAGLDLTGAGGCNCTDEIQAALDEAKAYTDQIMSGNITYLGGTSVVLPTQIDENTTTYSADYMAFVVQGPDGHYFISTDSYTGTYTEKRIEATNVNIVSVTTSSVPYSRAISPYGYGYGGIRFQYSGIAPAYNPDNGDTLLQGNTIVIFEANDYPVGSWVRFTINGFGFLQPTV